MGALIQLKFLCCNARVEWPRCSIPSLTSTHQRQNMISSSYICHNKNVYKNWVDIDACCPPGVGQWKIILWVSSGVICMLSHFNTDCLTVDRDMDWSWWTRDETNVSTKLDSRVMSSKDMTSKSTSTYNLNYFTYFLPSLLGPGVWR